MIQWICYQITPLSILSIIPELINHLILNFKWNERTIVNNMCIHMIQFTSKSVYLHRYNLWNTQCPPLDPYYTFYATLPYWSWFACTLIDTTDPLTLFLCWFMVCILIPLLKVHGTICLNQIWYKIDELPWSIICHWILRSSLGNIFYIKNFFWWIQHMSNTSKCFAIGSTIFLALQLHSDLSFLQY